jgi:hypothetical protein
MHEALGMRAVSGVEDDLAPGDDGRRGAAMHITRREERDAAVVVLLVVPAQQVGEEPIPKVAQGSEA